MLLKLLFLSFHYSYLIQWFFQRSCHNVPHVSNKSNQSIYDHRDNKRCLPNILKIYLYPLVPSPNAGHPRANYAQLLGTALGTMSPYSLQALCFSQEMCAAFRKYLTKVWSPCPSGKQNTVAGLDTPDIIQNLGHLHTELKGDAGKYIKQNFKLPWRGRCREISGSRYSLCI